MKIDIRGLSEDQIIEFFKKKGFDSYREDKFMNGFGKSPHIRLII